MEFNSESLTVFKLMNGEVIICEIVSEDESQVTVRHAIRAIEIFSDEGCNICFTQWIPFTDNCIIISRHGIIAFATPSDDMKQMYLNKMAEQEEKLESEEVEIPPFRHTCHNHAF